MPRGRPKVGSSGLPGYRGRLIERGSGLLVGARIDGEEDPGDLGGAELVELGGGQVAAVAYGDGDIGGLVRTAFGG